MCDTRLRCSGVKSGGKSGSVRTSLYRGVEARSRCNVAKSSSTTSTLKRPATAVDFRRSCQWRNGSRRVTAKVGSGDGRARDGGQAGMTQVALTTCDGRASCRGRRCNRGQAHGGVGHRRVQGGRRKARLTRHLVGALREGWKLVELELIAQAFGGGKVGGEAAAASGAWVARPGTQGSRRWPGAIGEKLKRLLKEWLSLS